MHIVIQWNWLTIASDCLHTRICDNTHNSSRKSKENTCAAKTTCSTRGRLHEVGKEWTCWATWWNEIYVAEDRKLLRAESHTPTSQQITWMTVAKNSLVVGYLQLLGCLTSCDISYVYKLFCTVTVSDDSWNIHIYWSVWNTIWMGWDASLVHHRWTGQW